MLLLYLKSKFHLCVCAYLRICVYLTCVCGGGMHRHLCVHAWQSPKFVFRNVLSCSFTLLSEAGFLN